MGICSSCLGRERTHSDEDDSSRLLFDDPHAINYGSFGDQNPGTPQADPQDVQRETEALQKIVAQTSNHLVDIFAMVPQNLQRSPMTNYTGQDVRLMQYQDVLAKLSSDNNLYDNSAVAGAGDPSQDEGEWPSDDDEEDDEASAKDFGTVKSEIGPLVGGFAAVERASK